MNAILNNLRAGAISVACLISFASVSLAEETPLSAKSQKASVNETGLGDKTSEYIRDYLSDPRRSGSLAGSIIGGALSAHPAGPILGSLVGFLVGKQSMFNEEKAQKERATMLYARRDIVPQGGDTLQTLSFTNLQGVTFNSPATVSAPVGQSQLMAPTFSRDQIAAMCGGGSAVDPRFRALCFYSQGG